MNSDSLNMVSRLGEGHMPYTFFLSEPQLKTTVITVFCFRVESLIQTGFWMEITWVLILMGIDFVRHFDIPCDFSDLIHGSWMVDCNSIRANFLAWKSSFEWK